MFLSADTLKLLMESGLSQEKVLEIYRALEADFRAIQPAASNKSVGAARTARWRERHKSSPNVTCDAENEASQNVTKRHIVTESDALTRVEDIKPKLVLTGDTTPETRERDFTTRPDLDWLEGQLREAGGAALANQANAPGMAMLGPVLAFLKADPPCLLDADVLPAIRARSANARPGSIRSWAYFREAVFQARDSRVAEGPEVASPAAYRPTGPPSFNQQADASWQEAKRRILETGT